jgi:microcystin-dependent protein
MSGSIGTRYYTANPFEIDANGVPLAGAQLFAYLTGTSTPQNTYADVNLTTPNTNPILADSSGRFGAVFLLPSPAYKFELWTAPTVENPSGVLIWTEDPVGPGAGGVPSNTAGIVGEVRAFAGIASAIPSGWYPAYGQAVSRTTYSAAFAVLGTTWGAGDGTTTFNLPDLNGRGLFGKDDMGGTAANRITSGVSGISGVTLGATGGSQAVQSHLHTLNDPGHVHTITDPGHTHAVSPTGMSGLYGSGNFAATSAEIYQQAGVTIDVAETGITINNGTTDITMDTYGAGDSQNMPPAAIVYWIIYLGV